MPPMNLRDAMLEADEDEAIKEEVSNLVHFGTDDPKKVKQIVDEMVSAYAQDDDALWEEDSDPDMYMGE